MNNNLKQSFRYRRTIALKKTDVNIIVKINKIIIL